MSQTNQRRQKTVNFSFQLTAEPQSPYWALLQYYQRQSKERVRQLIIEAAAGYWKAFCCSQIQQWEDLFQQRQVVEACIYQLNQQINLLQSQFNLGELEGEIKAIKFLPDQGNEAVELDFRYQVQAPEQGGLIQYLMNSGIFSLEQKILWSSQAYWGAIAHRALGLLPPEQLKSSAANCIYLLRQHINFLEKSFEELRGCANWLRESTSNSSPLVRLPVEVTPTQAHRLKGYKKMKEIRYIKDSETQAFSQSSGSVLGVQTEDGNGSALCLGDPENDELMLNSFKDL